MSSDDAYAAFLEKANEDPSASSKTAAAAPVPKRSGGLAQLHSVDDKAPVSAEIRAKTDAAAWVYVSDTDEAFVPVSLKIAGKEELPDEDAFAKLIHLTGGGKGIEIMDVTEWDRAGSYREVVEAVRSACGGGDVMVYRVPRGGTRVEYWVVGVNEEEGRLVGVKALAIES